MMGSMQRVGQETVGSQKLANAIEIMNRTESTATERRRATLSEELVGQHVIRRFRA